MLRADYSLTRLYGGNYLSIRRHATKIFLSSKNLYPYQSDVIGSCQAHDVTPLQI